MTNRNTKHNQPSIENGFTVEGQRVREPEEEKEGEMKIIESRLRGKTDKSYY